LLGIDEVIVVAEDAPHTQRCRNPAETLHEELRVAVASVHLVAGEDDEVGIESLRQPA
jgi:hypothetical protein